VSDAVSEQGWVTQPLIEVATLQRGHDLPVQDRGAGSYPIFAANGPVGFHDIAKCTGPGVVTGRSGTIGKVHFVEGAYWPLNTSLYVTDFHGNHPKWVYYMLRCFGLERFAQGAGVPTLNRNLVHGEPIRVPPLSEQRRIAAILDQADALRAKRREALAQLDSLTHSIFIEMFGGDQSQEWPIETIADVVAPHDGAIRTGPFGSQLLHSEFVAEGVAVLGIDNAVANEFRWGERRFITEAKYRDLRRYTVKPGDVLITIMGTCGRCAVVPDDIPVAVNTKHLCCITVNAAKCRPEFLHAFFLRHPMARTYLEQTSKGAIMSGLNMGLIKSMPISLPPLALQKTFATRIQAVEALKTAHRAALAESDALFASLQHRAFSGAL
jgi:type I restriction enzyme, S subunit